MTLRLQPISIATADGNEVVVSSGLTPGMEVVATGVHVLSPGQKVTIYQQSAPSAVAPSAQSSAPAAN
jgi:multidrug efflux pump subunit AcrA (membrane-fusion protein)